MYRYREGGSFTHNGVEYDLDCVLEIVEDRQVEQYPLQKLRWILDEMPTGYFDEREQRDRTRLADVTVPVIITGSNESLVVIDGIHRLKRACELKMAFLPGRYISEEDLSTCEI